MGGTRLECMSSLRMSALAKMMDGVITLEEVVANTAPDCF
jgi:type IV pilus assembly protein PilB